jgi:hypothetical protein
MKIRTLKALVVAMGLAGAMQAQAFDAKWEVGLGYDGGGDKLASVTVNSNLTGSSTQSVSVGQGVAFTVGAAMSNDDAKQFETVASIGYKTGGPRADNGKLTFTSVPLTLMEFYRPNDMRLGLGVTYSLSPEYTEDTPNSKGSISYDGAVGLVAQVGWAPVAQRYSVDLRYTSIKYQPSSANFNGVNYSGSGAPKSDGSSIGLYGSVRF